MVIHGRADPDWAQRRTQRALENLGARKKVEQAGGRFTTPYPEGGARGRVKVFHAATDDLGAWMPEDKFLGEHQNLYILAYGEQGQRGVQGVKVGGLTAPEFAELLKNC